ncbi:MAG: small nuclear ribonucleoprotein (Sm) [Candidatus Bathyarchaeota archaeon]
MSNDLSKMLNKNVVIGLRKGLQYSGKLVSIDNYWNIVLENAVESVESKLTAKYGKVILRGNRILYISTMETT